MNVNEDDAPGATAHDPAVDLTDVAAKEAEPTPVPDVDELEDRLRDLQGAMDHLQSGDLDGAERAIEALEARLEPTRD